MLRVGLLGDVKEELAEALTGLGAVKENSDGAGICIERADEPFSRFNLVVGAGEIGDGEMADVWLDVRDPQRFHTDVEELWNDRLIPFESNIRSRRRAPRIQRAVILDPDPMWQTQARRLISRLDHAIGERAIRTDHIGSTSVPGLPAKNLIDIQIVVGDLEMAKEAVKNSVDAGFVPVSGYLYVIDQHGEEYEELVAADADPGRPVNVHIHPLDSPVWREMLLFRDWLRSNPDNRDEYVTMKRNLAARSDRDVNDYGKDKEPWIRAAISHAERWATEIGWTP